jgi:AcrR family transcriptional regulator
MKTVRLDPKSRRKMIVEAAIACATDSGLWHIDFKMVADRCKVETSEATVRRYFHTAQELRDAVVEVAPGLVDDERGRE